MAPELQDGPYGLEAQHEWRDAATAALIFALNDLSTDPHVMIIDIAGLWDFEIPDVSESKTEAVGDEQYPSRPVGKNVTYTVEIRASAQTLLRRGGALLRAAFGPDPDTGLAPTRTMFITPRDAPTVQHVFSAQCLQCVQGSDVQEHGPTAQPTPWKRSVVLGFKLPDPRIYEWDEEAEYGFVSPKW